MTCKYNYAGSGKEIMPKPDLRDRGERIWQTINTSDTKGTCAFSPSRPIDIRAMYHIIIFTQYRRRIASQEDQLAQARCPPATRMLEPTAGAGHGSSVPTERFFRRRRPRPSQVRDAATRPDRSEARQSSGSRIRLLSTNLLSRRAGLSTAGTIRVASRKAWTPASTQADPTGTGIRATDPIRAAILGHGPSGRRDSRTLRRYRSPTEYRAGSGARGKKTTNTRLNQDPAPQGTGVTLLALYENLRQQVLAGLGSNGLGMSVFLGQGMAVWMKACSPTLTVPPIPALRRQLRWYGPPVSTAKSWEF